MTLITVVVPAHNVAKWVGETLVSIQNQSAADWECIVVDDASTDGTAAAARSIADGRIRVITHPVNRGVSAALNTVIRAARGAYIQILGADDLIQPEKFLYQSRFLDGHPDIGIVYGEIRYFDDGAPTVLRRGPLDDEETMLTLSGGRDVFLPALLERNGLPMQASLIHRRVFEEVGLHDESLRSSEDYEWCLRAAMADVRIAYLATPN
jgi:glycosyltransferase involved in cell wall biosynthesis